MKYQISHQVSSYMIKHLVLYEYTNKEQDVIKNAFRIGTFNSIRDLPDEIAPFAVTHNLKVRI